MGTRKKGTESPLLNMKEKLRIEKEFVSSDTKPTIKFANPLESNM